MLCFGGVARVRGGIDRLLAGVRLAAGRLVDRRTDGRADFGVAVRGLDTVDFGLAVVALGLAVVALAWTLVEVLTVLRLAVVRGLAAALGLAVVLVAAVVRVPVVLDFAAVLGLLVVGLVVEAFGFALVLDLAVDFRAVDDLVAAGRRDVVAAGLAVDMVLAATVSAFAAAVMDLVAVFMARIADDIVLADDVAFVAAAVILEAADVTLVAADDTVRAADAGVAPFDEVLRVERDAVRRAPVPRVDRAAVLRVDREEVLRVERDAGFRVVDEAVPAGLAAVLRFAVGLARLTVPALVFGRLAVPDALRLTDLLLAVLAELRRLAARVVV